MRERIGIKSGTLRLLKMACVNSNKGKPIRLSLFGSGKLLYQMAVPPDDCCYVDAWYGTVMVKAPIYVVITGARGWKRRLVKVDVRWREIEPP